MLIRSNYQVGSPVAVLLMMQVLIFIATADRGLDLTDESYYLLSYQHGRDLTASPTFFGVFLEGPFRLLGEDVAAIRIFGLVTLLASGALLAARTYTFVMRESCTPWPFVVSGMAASLLYYVHLTTLRVPSYNLIVLVCFQVATTQLLTLCDARSDTPRLRMLAATYGLVLGICAFTKAPSALALAASHLLFFLVVAPSHRIFTWAAFASTGGLFVALVLAAVHPRWPEALRSGIAITAILQAGYGALPIPTVRTVVLLTMGAIFGGLLAWSLRRGMPIWATSVTAIAVMAVAIAPFANLSVASDWWPTMVVATGIAWCLSECASWAGKQRQEKAKERRRRAAALLLLLTLPIGYSIGTNNGLALHSRMAGSIALLALLLALHHLHALGIVSRSALAITMAMPCIPLLVVQARAQFDVGNTYRLAAGLAEQSHPTNVGHEGHQLLLDAATHAAISALSKRMSSAGYRTGEPILDVTGDGPGLVYALGGRPLGVAWLLGGYPGSERAAAKVLASVPSSELQRAWVISSDENPRALRHWAELLREASGGNVALHAVGQVEWLTHVRPGRDVTKPPVLTLWRPRQPQM